MAETHSNHIGKSNPGALQLEGFVLIAPAHDLLHVMWCAFNILPKVFAPERVEGLEEYVLFNSGPNIS